MSNILFIVEGAKDEKNLFKQLTRSFNLNNYTIYVYGTNIYSLYNKMKKYEFNVNIVDLLKETNNKDNALLNKTFSYIYLIFDADVHHTTIPNNVNLTKNTSILNEMASFFVDETDPTIGKLYINYPMIESYKDCDSFFDINYKNKEIPVSKIKDYKKIVKSKKFSQIPLNSYTKDNFSSLIKQNIYKANYIVNNKWEKFSYNEYLLLTSKNLIIEKEISEIINNHKIQVLNTSLFFITDYFGNKDNFFDNLINK